jgi:hypothetical protein
MSGVFCAKETGIRWGLLLLLPGLALGLCFALERQRGFNRAGFVGRLAALAVGHGCGVSTCCC